jgi:hypothetical protein
MTEKLKVKIVQSCITVISKGMILGAEPTFLLQTSTPIDLVLLNIVFR